MIEASLISSILLSLGVAWFLFKPHLAKNSRTDMGLHWDSQHNLIDQKERVIQVLKDLELDYATGKVSLEDYNSTKASLELEATEVFERLDAIKQNPA